MIGRLLIRPYASLESGLRHPSPFVRRPAQAAVLAIATLSLALSKVGGEARARGGTDELMDRLASSEPLRAFLHGPGILRRPVGGRAFRSLLFRLSRAASVRARAGMGGRDLAVRLQGPIDQVVLRNLVIWHDRLLPPLLGRDDAGAVDLTIVLAGAAADEARLFDLVAIVLMLERIRGFALTWDEQAAQ